MNLLIVVIHIIVCIALIMIVLLQTGKGADMGAAFGGGGSNTLFGATGASTFLSKMTTVAAIVFMLTSLTLAYMASNRSNVSILDEPPAAQQNAPAQTVDEPGTQPEPQEAAPASDQQDAAPTTTQEADTGKTTAE